MNDTEYGTLLVQTLPRTIKTEEENRRTLDIIETLLSKGEAKMTSEENTLLELFAGLVQDFESKTYAPLPQSEPRELVQFLLDQRGLQPKDLWSVLGSKSRVSEILAGRRSISKLQAKKLGGFFSVSPAIFL